MEVEESKYKDLVEEFGAAFGFISGRGKDKKCFYNFYDIFDGNHRFSGILELVADPSHPKWSVKSMVNAVVHLDNLKDLICERYAGFINEFQSLVKRGSYPDTLNFILKTVLRMTAAAAPPATSTQPKTLSIADKKKIGAANRAARKNLELGAQEYLLSQGRYAQEGGFASDEEVKEFTKNVTSSVKGKIRLSEWMQGGPLACLSAIANLDLVLAKAEWEKTSLYLQKWIFNIKDCKNESSLFPSAFHALNALHVAINNLLDPAQYEQLLCMAQEKHAAYEYYEVSDAPIEVREKIGHRLFVVHLALLACKVWECNTMRTYTGEAPVMKTLVKVYLEPHTADIAKVVAIRMETFTSDILFLAKLQEGLAVGKQMPVGGLGQNFTNLQTSGVAPGSFDCASTCAHTRTHTLSH